MKQSRFSAMIKMTILSFLSLALLSFLAVFSQISFAIADEVADEIIVSATGMPTPAERLGASVDVISGDMLRRRQTVFLQDMLSTKGINIPQNGGIGTLSNVFLRGLPGKYTNLMVDGISLFDPGANQVMWNDVMVDGVGRIEILRGAHGVLYGSNSIAGVISQFTETGGEAAHQMRLEGGSFATRQLAMTGKGGEDTPYNYGYAFGHYVTDGISAADERDGNVEEDGYENTSFNGRLDINISPVLSLELAMRAATGEVDIDGGFPLQDDADKSEAFDRFAMRLGAVYDTGKLIHQLNVNHYESDIDDEDNFVITGSRRAVRQLAHYRGAYSHDSVAASWQFIFGAESQTSEFENTDGGFGRFDEHRIDKSALYALAQMELWSALTVTGALRQDDHELFGTHSTYRLAGALAVPGQMTLRFAHGTSYRAPALSELYMNLYGNPRLLPETGISTEAGIEMSLGKKSSMRLTLFDMEVEDLIGYDAVTYQNRQVRGTSRSHGAEFDLKVAVSERLTLTAHLNRTDSKKPSANGSGTIEREVRVPRFQSSVTFDWQNDRWQIGSTFRQVRDVIDVGNVSLENYSLVDFRAAYALGGDRQLTARVENALDEHYQTVLGYGTPGRAFYIGLQQRF
ncbi:MAG: TonB-dependent receptor plug domain-containing protein [Parvibaculales bacterium]